MINNKYVILLLEDSQYQTEQIIEYLKKDTLIILSAETIKEAKKILHDKGKNIDVLVLDLRLPDGDGFDFLKYVRKSKCTFPALVTSAYVSDPIQKKGDKLNVISYFEKPLLMSNLENAIVKALHLHGLNNSSY